MAGLKVDVTDETKLIAAAVAIVKARHRNDGAYAEEYERCRTDFVYFVNEYVMTYDPRPEAAPNIIPFKLYPFQVILAKRLEELYKVGKFDEFIEKSRDMGVSWLVLAFLVWCWLFSTGFQALIGSRVEDLVDNWEPDSMFWKMAFIIDHFPLWLRPRGYDESKNRQYLKLNNPQNGNAILGQSSNPNFSRQGRYSIVIMDEFQVWSWAQSAWTATADATTMRLIVCTAEPGSFAKTLRDSGKVHVSTIHWSQHPKKDREWYEREHERRTDEEIAKELDINWSGTVRGRVYVEWERVPKGEFPYQRGWPIYVSWDFGLADETALTWWQQNPQTKWWRAIDYFESSGQVIDWYAPFVTGLLPSGGEYEYSELEMTKIETHRTWRGAIHFGDPAGNQRNQVTKTSVIRELRKHNIHVQTKPDVNSFEARKTTTQLFLRRVEGVNMPACSQLDDAMMQARYPKKKEHSETTTETTKPIHDWTSHARTSVEYMAVNEPKADYRDNPKPKRIKPSWENRR